MVDWNYLAERCAKATGPDSRIDCLIENLAGVGVFVRDVPTGDFDLVRGRIRHLTASRDEISKLIECVLPGWAYKMGTCSVSDDAWLCPDLNDPVHGPRLMQQFGPITQGSVFDCGFDIDRRPSGNMALAMCEAFCRAMAAVAEKDATK